MATYFVNSARPDDTGAGTSWATAKKTISAATALIPNGLGGHKIYVAPGLYNESPADPSFPGASGNLNELIADSRSDVSDGAATSGVTPGQVVVYGLVSDAGNIFSLAWYGSTADYWRIKGFVFNSVYAASNSGTRGLLISKSPTNIGLGTQVEDCVVFSPGLGVQLYTSNTENAADTNKVIRCSIISPSSGWIYSQDTSLNTVQQNAAIVATSVTPCGYNQEAGLGEFTTGAFTLGAGGAQNQWVGIRASSAVAAQSSGGNLNSFVGVTTGGTVKLTAENNASIQHVLATGAALNAGSSYSGNRFAGAMAAQTGWTKESFLPFLQFPMLVVGTGLENVGTYVSRTGDDLYDITGQTKSLSNTTPGAIAFENAGYPLYATDHQVMELGGLPPEKVTGVSASDGLTDKVTISWDAAGGVPSSYKVYRNTVNVFSSATLIDSGIVGTTYDDTTVVNGTNYYFWVVATNSYGDGAESASDAGSSVAAGGGGVIMDGPIDRIIDTSIDSTI